MKNLEERAEEIRNMVGWHDGTDIEWGNILRALRSVASEARAQAFEEAASVCELMSQDERRHWNDPTIRVTLEHAACSIRALPLAARARGAGEEGTDGT